MKNAIKTILNRITLCSILCLTVVCLSGCVNVDTNITIDRKGNTILEEKTMIDNDLLRMIGDDIDSIDSKISKIKSKDDPNFTIEPIKESTATGVKITKKFNDIQKQDINLDELFMQDVTKTQLDSKRFVDVNKTFFTNDYDFNFNIAMIEDVKYIHSKLSVNIPVKAKKHNATSVDTKKHVYTWVITEPVQNVSLSYTTLNIGNILLCTLFLILVLLGLITFVILKRKTNTMECPNCGKIIKRLAKKCKYCGKWLNEEVKEDKQIRICPYCKEEIPEDVKKCPVCGDTLTKSVNIKIKLGVKAYVSIAIILVILLGTLGVLTARADDIKSAYTVIQKHETIAPDETNMTAKKAIDTMNEQSVIIKSYLEDKHFQESKDIVFSDYYKNMVYYISIVEARTGELLEVGNTDFLDGHSTFISNVTFKPVISTQDDYPSVENVIVTNPEAPYITFSCDEGTFVPVLNDEYLYKTYSSNLGEAWKKYLTLKQEEWKKLSVGTDFTPIDMANFIIALQNFKEKYPNFSMLEEVNKDMGRYVVNVILNTYLTFDYNNNNTITPEAKQAYEKFLNEADNKSNEYKVIKEAYDIVKKHNYKYSNELENYRNNYANQIGLY